MSSLDHEHVLTYSLSSVAKPRQGAHVIGIGSIELQLRYIALGGLCARCGCHGKSIDCRVVFAGFL